MLRLALTMVTTEANQSVWDGKIGQANTQTLEFEKRYTIDGQKGSFRVLTFLNNGKFGNYGWIGVCFGYRGVERIDIEIDGHHFHFGGQFSAGLGRFAESAYLKKATWHQFLAGYVYRDKRHVHFGGYTKPA